MAGQDPAHKGTASAAVDQTLGFRAKVTKAVSISNLVKGISSNLVIRVIQSS